MRWDPPPPLQSPTPCNTPLGDRHFHVFRVNTYCASLCCPSALHMALHCFPITSPNGPQFCHIWYIRPGGVTPVDHESAQLSTLEAGAVPQFALKYPCNPPPPGDRNLATVSPPPTRETQLHGDWAAVIGNLDSSGTEQLQCENVEALVQSRSIELLRGLL